MKRILIVSLILVALTGCSKKDSDTPSDTPSKCLVKYLFLKDDISYLNFQTLKYYSNQAYSYTWQQGFISRISGGFIPVPEGTNLSCFGFSATLASDSIIAENNMFRVFHIITDTVDSVFIKDSVPLTYYLDGNNRLIKVFDYRSANPAGDTIRYVYAGDQITEILNGTWTRRKFYFESNNLVRVVKETYNGQGILIAKNEILFTGYDSHPNPFKDKYYVTGAFFRAFSANNYQGYTVNNYSRSADSLMLVQTWHISTPLTYNSNGYPDFGQ